MAQQLEAQVADDKIKALYVEYFGSDKGWLGIEGSYFISGAAALRAQVERLQAERGQVVAWQSLDDGGSFVSDAAHKRNPILQKLYTVPLSHTSPPAVAQTESEAAWSIYGYAAGTGKAVAFCDGARWQRQHSSTLPAAARAGVEGV